MDRRLASDVPGATPRRGLSPHKLHFVSALPRIDGRASSEDLSEGVADLVDRARGAWSGPTAPPVRLLPRELAYDQLPLVQGTGAAVPIGVDEDNVAPVYVDFAAEPHLLVLGDVRSSRT